MSLSQNVKDIIQGWKNHLTNDPKAIESSKSKIEYCNECPLNVSGICVPYKKAAAIKNFNYKGTNVKEGELVTGCGCPLSKKTKSDSQCPRGYF